MTLQATVALVRFGNTRSGNQLPAGTPPADRPLPARPSVEIHNPVSQAPQRVTTEEVTRLVTLASGGDQAAYAQLITWVQRPLYFAVMRITRHPEDSRDIVQRAMLTAWKKIGDLESPSRFRSWIFAIALNGARNHVRDQARRAADPIEEQCIPAPGTDPLTQLGRQEQRVRLRHAMERLPGKQHQCVSLRIDAELSFREIAEIVGCSEGSARVNFHHGLQRLKAELTGADHE